MTAQSHLVGADQVYTAREAIAVYVVDVVRGWVVADVYDGTTRGERVRLPRAVFDLLFTNYSFNGSADADAQRSVDARPVGGEPGRACGVRAGDGLRGAAGLPGGVSS